MPLCADMQEDITRGRDRVESLYQGQQGTGGTHNAVLSSSEYMANAQRNLNNIEDGFYIAPAFLDKLSIHVAKNFLDLPKIKVPLILGGWQSALYAYQQLACKLILSLHAAGMMAMPFGSMNALRQLPHLICQTWSCSCRASLSIEMVQ